MTMFNYLRQINREVTETQYPDDYFAVNIEILKIATIWYPENSKDLKYGLYYMFSIFSFLFCIVFCTPSEFISLLYTWGDMSAFLMNLGIALTHGICNIKVINWYVRRKEILALMATLQSEEFQYEPCRNFEPGYIFQKAKQTNIMLSTMFFWWSIMVPISGYITGFYNFFFHQDSFYTTEMRTFQCISLPFFSWIPFDHSSEWTCALAMIFQSFPMIYLTLMIIAVDTLFMGLINNITAHLLVLQGAFNTIRTRALQSLGREEYLQLHDDMELNREMLRSMKKCIGHLQTVQRLCDLMENIYSMQTLCQVLVSLFVLCTCLFLISTEPIGSKTFVVEVIYILAIEYQLTLYCWFGNELTLASIGIPGAIYKGDWLSASEDFKRLMMITMIRMKRPLFLTVGKFTPLTLETLQAILRGSYSLYAVLKNRDTSA